MVEMSELVPGDLPSAARRRLIDAMVSSDAARVAAGAPPMWLGEGGLVGQDGVDGMPEGPHGEAWVFPGLDNDGRPLRPVEGTNKCSVVVMSRDHWNSNPHNTMVMPMLRVLVYADTIRDEGGNPRGRFADLRVKRIAQLVDTVFHDASNGARSRSRGEGGPDGHTWNPGKDEELYVVSCYRSPGGGLNMMDVVDNDFAVRGDLRYEVAVAGWFPDPVPGV